LPSNLSSLDALVQDVFIPGLPNWVNTQRPLFGRLEKKTKKRHFTGRKFVFAAKDANPQGTGAIAEGEDIPAAGESVILNMDLAMKYHYACARLSAQLVESASSDVGAFADAVKTELGGVRDQLEEDLAVSGIFGDGSGAIGEVTSYSGTTLTMKNQPTVGQFGTRLLRRNMFLSSFSAKSGGSAGAAHKKVSAVASTTTATVPTSAGFVANDFVFRSANDGIDPRGKVQMGLGGIVDDGTRVGTFQGLSRTTNPSLKANVLGNAGALRAWSDELMDQLVMEAWNNGGGGLPSAVYSPLEIQRRAASHIRADRRYDMAVKQLDGGYSGVEWTLPSGKSGSVPWFVDRFCIPNEIMAVKEDDLFLAIQEDVSAINTDGSIFRFTDRKDEVEAWFRTWRNIGARQCNNCTTLKDISHTA
jgi:hypothetical protein